MSPIPLWKPEDSPPPPARRSPPPPRIRTDPPPLTRQNAFIIESGSDDSDGFSHQILNGPPSLTRQNAFIIESDSDDSDVFSRLFSTNPPSLMRQNGFAVEPGPHNSDGFSVRTNGVPLRGVVNGSNGFYLVNGNGAEDAHEENLHTEQEESGDADGEEDDRGDDSEEGESEEDESEEDESEEDESEEDESEEDESERDESERDESEEDENEEDENEDENEEEFSEESMNEYSEISSSLGISVQSNVSTSKSADMENSGSETNSWWFCDESDEELVSLPLNNAPLFNEIPEILETYLVASSEGSDTGSHLGSIQSGNSYSTYMTAQETLPSFTTNSEDFETASSSSLKRSFSDSELYDADDEREALVALAEVFLHTCQMSNKQTEPALAEHVSDNDNGPSVERQTDLDTKLDTLTKELETLSSSKEIVPLLIRRAGIYEALQRPDRALTDLKDALQRDPQSDDAKAMARQIITALSAGAGTNQQTEKKIPSPPSPRALLLQTHLKELQSMNVEQIKAFVRSSDFDQVLQVCGAGETEETDARVASFMVLTRLFNPEPELQQEYPINFIIEQCAKRFSQCIDSGKSSQKLLAYRTLNAIFQTSATVGASILSQEGVVEEMIDTVEFEVLDVQVAIVNILAIASSDKTCRKLIVKHGSEWLAKTASMASIDKRLSSTAATTLTKLRTYGDSNDQGDAAAGTAPSEDNLLEQAMRRVHLKDEDLLSASIETIKGYEQQQDPSILLHAVESLAYTSLDPSVKEAIASDSVLLETFSSLADAAAHKPDNPLLFGIGTIFENITKYRPLLSDQQRQVKRLRDLANAKKTGKSGSTDQDDDPRDNDKAVERRIQQAIKNGAGRVMIIMARSKSANIQGVMARTSHQLVTPQAHRGFLIQQGLVRALLPLLTVHDASCMLAASQTLAKIAITTDPRLAFGNQVLDLVRPFLGLCKDESQLRQFEGLMALTNLASTGDAAQLKIHQEQGMNIVENLQLSSNDLVQRAATELVCNMTFCEPVFESYSDPKRAQNKIRLLMILSDCEDVGTRRAASGALAILANSPGTCEMMALVDNGYGRIVRLIESKEQPEVQHRGLEIMRCMLSHEPDKSKVSFGKEGALSHLDAIIKKRQQVVSDVAKDVRAMLAA